MNKFKQLAVSIAVVGSTTLAVQAQEISYDHIEARTVIVSTGSGIPKSAFLEFNGSFDITPNLAITGGVYQLLETHSDLQHAGTDFGFTVHTGVTDNIDAFISYSLMNGKEEQTSGSYIFYSAKTGGVGLLVQAMDTLEFGIDVTRRKVTNKRVSSPAVNAFDAVRVSARKYIGNSFSIAADYKKLKNASMVSISIRHRFK